MATTIGETGGKNKSEGELQSEEEDEYTPRDEVQFLLESYVLRLNNILNDITLLQQKVKNRQSLTDISMQVHSPTTVITG